MSVALSPACQIKRLETKNKQEQHTSDLFLLSGCTISLILSNCRLPSLGLSQNITVLLVSVLSVSKSQNNLATSKAIWMRSTGNMDRVSKATTISNIDKFVLLVPIIKFSPLIVWTRPRHWTQTHQQSSCCFEHMLVRQLSTVLDLPSGEITCRPVTGLVEAFAVAGMYGFDGTYMNPGHTLAAYCEWTGTL